MDAISLLKDDHRKVNALFTKFEHLGGEGQKAKLVRQIITELAVHSVIEEQVFYPFVRKLSEELDEQILRSLEEHHLVKVLLYELDKMPPTSERYSAKVEVLIEAVRHHVEEEETELFPLVKRHADDEQLRATGELMQKAKKLAPTRPHPAAPDQPPGNILAGAGAALMDRARHVGRELVRAVEGKRGESVETKAIRSATGARPSRTVRRASDRAKRRAKATGRRVQRTAKKVGRRMRAVTRRASKKVQKRTGVTRARARPATKRSKERSRASRSRRSRK